MQNKKSILTRVFVKLLWTTKKMAPKKYHYIFYYYIDFLEQKHLLSCNKNIFCLSKKMLPRDYLSFDLKKYHYKEYIRSFYNIKRSSLNGDANNILIDKLLFENKMNPIVSKEKNYRMIESMGIIKSNKITPLNNSDISDSLDSIKSVLNNFDLILKPRTGAKGKGILLLQRKFNEELYLINGSFISWDSLLALLSRLDNYLIQRRFEQEGFSKDYYPKTLNTLRVATMIDPENNHPFIAYALHRFGSSISGYTDNSNQGGISAEIDIESGIMGTGKTVSSGKTIEYIKHPDSNIRIYETKVPFWNECKNGLLKIATNFMDLKYVGWDVVLSNDQFFILEGNNGPGISSVQIHRPLNQYEHAWNFFRHYRFM